MPPFRSSCGLSVRTRVWDPSAMMATPDIAFVIRSDVRSHCNRSELSWYSALRPSDSAALESPALTIECAALTTATGERDGAVAEVGGGTEFTVRPRA